MMETKQIKNIGVLNIPIPIYLRVSINNSCPCIDARLVTTNSDLIKALVSAAFHEKSILFQPVFKKNKFMAISSLVDRGILYRDGAEFKFLI